MTGTLKTKTPKGFGFIIVDGEKEELFFHGSSCLDVTFDQLNEGDKLTFDMGQGPKGPNATNVRRV
jgi:CspA family cold shock protein